jgi:hypothetical protein
MKSEMGVACSTYRGQDRCIQFFVGNPEVNRTLRISKYVKEDNIRMDLHESIRREYTSLV